jgi:hypothetical protein
MRSNEEIKARIEYLKTQQEKERARFLELFQDARMRWALSEEAGR